MIIRNLVQRTPEWLNWRREGITATEAAVVLGKSPYMTPWRLWCEKTERALPPDLERNPLVQYGVTHEERARELFQVNHTEVLMPVCAEYEPDPLFRASFDGITAEDEPVEIKCPAQSTLAFVRTLGKESAPYRLYFYQVQHQLLVSGAKRGWLVFYDGVKGELIEFAIDRDETVISEILTKGRDFWDRHIALGNAPAKDPERDVYVPIGIDAESWLAEASRYSNAAKSIADLQARIDELEEERQSAKARLTSLMGEYRYADYGGVALTKRVTVGRVDWKRLLEEKSIPVEALDAYRGKPTESWLVRLTNRCEPKSFVASDLAGF